MAGRERFVPQRAGKLADDLAQLPWSDEHGEQQYRAFSRLAAALFHYEFHDRQQAMVDAWEAAVADPTTGSELTATLTGLLDGANYEPLTRAELADALDRESLVPLRLDVDLSDYDEVLVYHRGSERRTVQIPRWRGLLKTEREITVDERVVVHTRVKPQSWFDQQKRDPAKLGLVPGHVSLKLFQDVPRADIEMLLPSTQVRFRFFDTLTIVVPAVASGVAVLTTKLLPTLGLIFLLVGAWLGLRDEPQPLDQTALVIMLGGAMTLGGFLSRQWNTLKNRRVAYLKTLSENLYFRTVADGPGVVHTLLSAAEQQEVIEVLLGYRFLLDHPDGTTPKALDEAIEAWLRTTCNRDIDFEIDDAIAKLRRLEIAQGRRSVRPVPLPEALVSLDRRWDDLFRHGDDGGWTFLSDGDGDGGLVQLRRVVDRFTGALGDRILRREDGEAEPAGTS